MKSFAKICVALLASLTLTAGNMNAQTDSTSASTNMPPTTAPKHSRGRSFRGKIASVDMAAKTITLTGPTQRQIQITSKTKIYFNGAPGTLEDAAAGLRVSGERMVDSSTNWTATTLHIGETKRAATPPPVMPSSTNSPDK